MLQKQRSARRSGKNGNLEIGRVHEEIREKIRRNVIVGSPIEETNKIDKTRSRVDRSYRKGRDEQTTG